jgi:hypothetical protein
VGIVKYKKNVDPNKFVVHLRSGGESALSGDIREVSNAAGGENLTKAKKPD